MIFLRRLSYESAQTFNRAATLFRVTLRMLITIPYGHTWRRAVPLKEAENKHLRKPERGFHLQF